MSTISEGTSLPVEYILYIAAIVWGIFYVLQLLMAYGTAYRRTKMGRDNGVGLFIYLLGFSLAAIIPGLGIHYYVKYLQQRIIIQQPAPQQPQIIRVVEKPQQNNVYSQQNAQQVYETERLQRNDRKDGQ